MSDLGTRRTPYSIPDGTTPYPEDRVTWAMEQVPYLSLSDTFILTFLSRHAWGGDADEPGQNIGLVPSRWSSQRRLAKALGVTQRTVMDALARLREGGYISYARDVSKGPGAPSEIRVWWYEKADIMREQVRANERALPEIFQSVGLIEEPF